MTKQETAKQRIEYALHHLTEAQEAFDHVVQELMAADGSSPAIKTLQALSKDAKRALYELRDSLKLNREPAEDRGDGDWPEE